MAEYATLWYYSKVLNNVTAFITPYLKGNLQRAFPYISMPAMHADQIPDSCKKEFITMHAQNDHRIVKFFERIDNDSLAFVNLTDTLNGVNLYHRYRRDIFCEFRFPERTYANVKAYKDHLHFLHCQHSKQCDKLRLVGVHVRRTDYKELLLQRVKRGFVNENFFLAAMELMVERMGVFDKEERLLFIVTSDDSSWCKAKFSQFKFNYSIIYTIDYYPLVRQKYLHAHNLSHCSNKGCNQEIETEYVNFDLALMSSMNYNILDYGTFGLWGAYLSQGEITIAADIGDRRQDQVIAAGLEGFIFLQPP